MSRNTVGQYLNKQFKALTDLSFKRINVTIAGHHISDGLYSDFEGDNYELAKIHVQGIGVKQRPFMKILHDLLVEREKENLGKMIKRGLLVNQKLKTSDNYAFWKYIEYELETKCQELFPEVSAMLPPIEPTYQDAKTLAGYGTQTLFATGQLAQAIVVEVK